MRVERSDQGWTLRGDDERAHVASEFADERAAAGRSG